MARHYVREHVGGAPAPADVEAIAAVSWPVAAITELMTLLHLQLSAALAAQANPGRSM